MHPSRYLLRAFDRATLAPENDAGADYDDEALGPDEVGEDDEFDDEAGDEPDDEDEPEDEPEDAPQARQPTRGENRVARATREAKEAKDRAAALAAEVEALKRERQNPTVSPQEQARQRDAHLATLTAEQKVDFLLRENAARTEHQLNEIRFQTWDAGDKSSFQTLAAKNPALAGLEDEVEARLAELRAQGSNAPRENIAKFLLGERALARAPRARGKGARAEAAGREQNQASPNRARGDAAANRSRTGGNDLASLEKRLAGRMI